MTIVARGLGRGDPSIVVTFGLGRGAGRYIPSAGARGSSYESRWPRKRRRAINEALTAQGATDAEKMAIEASLSQFLAGQSTVGGIEQSALDAFIADQAAKFSPSVSRGAMLDDPTILDVVAERKARNGWRAMVLVVLLMMQ